MYWFHNRFAWMFNTLPGQLFLKAQVEFLPEGPSDQERAKQERVVVAEAEDRAGRRIAARLRVPDSYTFTSLAAVAIAERVIEGEFNPGFQTPALVYGTDFVLSLDGVSLEDLSI